MARVSGTPDAILNCVRCDRFLVEAVEEISRSFFLRGTMVLQLLWTVFAIPVREKKLAFSAGFFCLANENKTNSVTYHTPQSFNCGSRQ